MGEWKPIETAPKDGAIVLVWGCAETEWEDAEEEGRKPDYAAYPAYVSVQKSIWWMAGAGTIQICDATHWQPLPAPPGTTRAPADLRSALEADLDAEAEAYAADYVMTTEGADYEPTEWERRLIVDALHGFLAECAALTPTKGDAS